MTERITTDLPPPPPEPTCPECGAKLPDPDAAVCWMCHEPLRAERTNGPNPFRLPEPQGDNPGWAVFGGLAVLIIFGLAIESPGVLIALLVIAFPAMFRSLFVANREQSMGKQMTVGSLILGFFTSLGIIVVIGVASWMAFLITCFIICIGGLALSSNSPGGFRDEFFVFGLAFGVLAGLTVFVLLIRALSRRKDGP